MDELLNILGMLVLVALAGLGGRLLPRLPLPVLQIALGAAAAWPDAGLRVRLEPHLFMLLFLPPLLFAQAWELPKREFQLLRLPIVLLAVGLVFVGVLLLGWGLHAGLPDLPLSVAFVLAAVLAPTDTVAVSALAARHRLPPRLHCLLEGESLLNDASALVAVKFAAAAALSTQFSLPDASVHLLWTAAGGIATGCAAAWLFSSLYKRFVAGADRGAMPHAALAILLLPYGPYLLAEHLGCSGVLAAVAAGVATCLLDLRSSRFSATHLLTRANWDVLGYVLHGLIFVLLGMQLPDILRHLPVPLQAGQWPAAAQIAMLVLTSLAITLALLAVRALGVWLALRLALHGRPTPTALCSATLGGVRGAITLAAVLGLPHQLADGSPFPARDFLVFQATAVILWWLAAASVGLPPLLRALQRQAPAPDAHGREQRWARRRALRDAGALSHDPAARLRALQAQREQLHQLCGSRRINDKTLRTLVLELDLEELWLRQSGPAPLGEPGPLHH